MVVAPNAPIALGTDVPGRLTFRQGGSAATTARWLARLGCDVTLIAAIGADEIGALLCRFLAAQGVRMRPVVIPQCGTGRMGVLLDAQGERSFVQDRRAAVCLKPHALASTWLTGTTLLHLPAYSVLGEPLGSASRRAVALARTEGAKVSVDLSSSSFLLDYGRSAAAAAVAGLQPDVLFANEAEAIALLGHDDLQELDAVAPLVVIKRGSAEATVLWREGTTRRLDIPTPAIATSDTTGAGDAFDAGFISEWLRAPSKRRHAAPTLRAAVRFGQRAATRELTGRRTELELELGR